MSIEIAGVKVFTLKDLSEQLGVSVATLRAYVDTGRLEAVRVGRSYRVTEEALRRFLGIREAPSTGPAIPAKEDPILRVIGLGEDGELSRDLDREVYG